jgi:2-methylcitrate dehydratase PrpD
MKAERSPVAGSPGPGANTAGAGATRALAHHASSLRYAGIPAALVELTKQCVLDTLGVSIGSSTLAPEAKLVHRYVSNLGGKPESTILGFGGKAPAPWAVFVNGSLGHMLDYDDLGASHVSIATVPVAFAVAEKAGGVSGQELITAIAAGTDLQTRLYHAIRIPSWTVSEGWFATQLFGYIAGAATAGRLLGLDVDAMENALGIGFNQTSGSRQMAVGTATHMRSMQAGFSGQGAVVAAELAQIGITGPKEFVEGRYGLFRNYVRTDDPDWDAIVGELGTRFPLVHTHGFKVWPACSYTRPTNAATLQLRTQYGLRPDDVDTITIIGGSSGHRLLSEPIGLKRRPQTSIDGKYSVPFTTALMMAKGNVTLRDYTDEGLRDPAVLAMADRVSYRPLPGSPAARERRAGEDSALSRPTVEIRTRDGRVLVCQPEGVPGDATHPVSWDMLETKFRDCVSFSAAPIPARNVDSAVRMIRELEHVTDVTAIVRLLTGST